MKSQPTTVADDCEALSAGAPFTQGAADRAAPCCSPGGKCCGPASASISGAIGHTTSTALGAGRARIRRWLVPASVFIAIWAGHFVWCGLFPEKCDAAAGQTCAGEQCSEEACAAPTPPPSWMAAYIGGQHEYLGFSYAASLTFATVAFRRYRERRHCADRNLAIGGITISGVLAVAGCFLVGCCGSPMLVVWLNLFGAKFLPFAKPLMAGVTVASLGVTWWWMQRHERRAVAALADPESRTGCKCD